MDRKAELVVSPVVYLVLPEGDVADGEIIKVLAVCGLKARYSDVRLGLELLCNATGNAVKLDTVQL